MKRFVFSLVVAVGGVLSSGIIQAQTPLGTSFTYQGRMRSAGLPASGLHDLEFRLFDAATLGNQVGPTVCLDGVDVIEGLFTVSLDFGSQFMGAGRWLDIRVRADAVAANCNSGVFTPLTPRQPLSAAPYALALPGLWTQNNATSPNIVGGFSGNQIYAGVVGATISGGGSSTGINAALASFVTISGGAGNFATGTNSTIGGGEANIAEAAIATVSGGASNACLGFGSTVSGGRSNAAESESSTIGGGLYNLATGDFATIGGGVSNSAPGAFSVVGGGFGNLATDHATVVGGGDNRATASGATVVGGEMNRAGGAYSLAAGYMAMVRDSFQAGDANGDEGTFVWADSTAATFISTGPNQFLIRASGGVAINVNDPLGFTLAVNGEAAKPGGGSWAAYSDARLKSGIRPIGYALNLVLGLRGVEFEYSQDAIERGRGRPGTQVGFIAQDVEQVLPDWVGRDADGYKHVTERGATALLVEALRELKADNDNKEQQINSLAARVEALEAWWTGW